MNCFRLLLKLFVVVLIIPISIQRTWAKSVTLRPKKPLTTQINKANTTYVIRKDFDLEGQTLKMPENCVLKFNGGKLINGTICGSQTHIAAKKSLVLKNISIEGSWDNEEGYPEWFGAANDPNIDSKLAIQKAIDVAKTCVLSDVYYTAYNTPTGRGDVADVYAMAIKRKNIIGLKGNRIYIDAKFANTEKTSVFWVGDDVIIDGVNIEYCNEDYSGWTGIQAGVYRVQGGNVTIVNTTLRSAMAAWINLEGNTGRRGFVIRNNFVHDCDCGLIIQGNQHQHNEVYDINLLMENNVIEKEKNRHSEMVSFWGCAKDGGRVYYTNVTIRGNRFSGGWQGGCITGNPKYNGLRNIEITDNEFNDCGACTFYNTEGLLYERNFVTGSTFVERQVKGKLGSYPDLAFVNCKSCAVNDVSCFGLTFIDCKGFKIGKIKQTLAMDINDPYLAQKDYITNFIGIKAENSSVTIDELNVNPFKDDNISSEKCRYYIFKAKNSVVNVGKMRASIPVHDSEKLLKIKDFIANK